jgi:ABC-type cobalamin/Fe3+-siderophores transport systems, ATPase components
MIEVRNLSFRYLGGPPVLEGVTLAIPRGEVVNILGPNGSGKTTLLKLILGFMPVPPETVFVDSRPIGSVKRKDLARLLAYVPQSHAGVFHYKAQEVVLMGRTAASPWLRFSAADYKRAGEVLEKVRISHLADRSYLRLSGGERQLVLIARALAQESAYLIMDEPVTGLDYGNQFHLLSVIRELAESGLSIVLTTHHPEQAVFLGGRALMFKEGRLVADGPADGVITAASICDLYGLPPGVFPQSAATAR